MFSRVLVSSDHLERFDVVLNCQYSFPHVYALVSSSSASRVSSIRIILDSFCQLFPNMRIVNWNLTFVVCREPESKYRSLGCLRENDWWEECDDGRFVALDFLIKENSPKIDSENLLMLLSMYMKKNHANKSQKENNNENITNNNHDYTTTWDISAIWLA